MTVLQKLKGYLRAAPILALFSVSSGLSYWGSLTIPEPTVNYLLTQDYVTQAELWKRRVLAHLKDGVTPFQSAELSQSEQDYLEQVPEASDVYRLKLFDAKGRVFWSSRPEDIGKTNSEPYFTNVIAAGGIYTKRTEKDPGEIDDLAIHALNTSIQEKHIVYEVYVPISNNGLFVGALEFYTDATTLHHLTMRRIEIDFVAVAALLTLMLTGTAWVFLSASRHQVRVANRQTAEEREFVEKQMQLAREVQLLGDLNEWLQSSQSLQELFDMVARFMGHLLPDAEGSLYVYSNSRDVLDGCTAWNGGDYKPHIHPEDCWGLRRGRTYEYGRNEVNFCCSHAEPHDERPYYCFPILAHGETVGLMHLRRREGSSNANFYQCKKLAQMCAEQVSMAIANVRMRDQLQEQSTRDPLTGLFNRRYMLDRLRRLLNAASAKGEKVHLIYLDVDHFKKFNDDHGHDAGDVVLGQVATCLQEACDGDDVACRMGGEEFMLIWPASDQASVTARADVLRKKIEALRVPYQEKHLPTVTISAGIACFPDHERDIQTLLRLADEALYAAKDGGRNQVHVYGAHDRKTVAVKSKPLPPSSLAAE
ncbi:diguanylate cyclase [Cognatishimia sp.]|uniref:sensor domain-containing diguanylate cyclase n=1 Tax=Cognatishimia sp. TaxID=2211648 RepID=UPI003517857F